MKIYLDQTRLYVIPDVKDAGINKFGIRVAGNCVVPNIRIAEGGGLNMIGQKFTDTKILFNPAIAGAKCSSCSRHFQISRMFIVLLLMVMPLGFSCAQSCSWFPADCPSDRQLPDSAERFGNPVIPAEVSMEIRLHHFLTALMQREAEKKRLGSLSV